MGVGMGFDQEPQHSAPQHYDPNIDTQKEVSSPPPPWQPGYIPKKEEPMIPNPTGGVSSHETARPKRICGLSPLLFGLMIGMATAVVLAAAIGGGLGGALAHARNSNINAVAATVTVTTTLSSPTSTVSSAAAATTAAGGLLVDYNATAPLDVSSVPLDCPALDGLSYTSGLGDVFTLSCKNSSSGDDLMSLPAYSYQVCLDCCSYYNHWQTAQNATTLCSNVEFAASMANNVQVNDGNCWLKGDNPNIGAAGGTSISATLTKSG